MASRSLPDTSIRSHSMPIPGSVDRSDPEALARSLIAIPIERPMVISVTGDGDVIGEPLVGDSVIIDLLAHRPTRDVTMVGLVAPASVSRRDGDEEWNGAVVHLVTRAGVSVTAVTDAGPVPCDVWDGPAVTVFGPDLEPQTGRVPDACRRLLGLPTPPPATSMTPFVFGAWLEVIGGRVDDELLEWPEIVACHPATATLSADPTPAELAAATRELGESMDWDRFRRVIATVGGFPFGPDGVAVAERADAGMFSRWAMDELPSTVDALGRLAHGLTPVAHDRIWAAAHLCDALPCDAADG